MNGIEQWLLDHGYEVPKNTPDSPKYEGSLIDLIEAWCKERGFQYARRGAPPQQMGSLLELPSTLAIRQDNGLLITIEGDTIATNDHLGYACNKSMIKKQDEMRAIEYLDMHDPDLFKKLEDLIVGKITYGVIRVK